MRSDPLIPPRPVARLVGLLLGIFLLAGCSTSRRIIYPAHQTAGIEHRGVVMRLHGTDRQADAVLAWIDIDNRSGQPVAMARLSQRLPQYSERFIQVRLVGAGMAVDGLQRPARKPMDVSHLRIAPGEHIRLALSFEAPGVDLANGLSIQARAWTSDHSEVWTLPVPDEVRTASHGPSMH